MRAIKLVSLLGIMVIVLSFAGLGVKTVWQEMVDLDYPSQFITMSSKIMMANSC